MTVCIAALCDNGRGCVFASDQMTTAHFPLGYEFESEEVEKILKIGKSAHVLISGDVLFANEVIDMARPKLEGKGDRVSIVADEVRGAYQTVRKLRLIHNELEPRGLTLDSYYQSQQRLVAGIVQMIDQALKSWNPAVDLLVVGVDSSGCHICTVGNPGLSICHDPIGFAAIGSGAPHAIYSLIESDYRKSLSREMVESLVGKAKERSQVAPGVGAKTRMAYIELAEEVSRAEASGS